MNIRRVKELKIHYAVSLIEILRTLRKAGECSEEHAEAIRQIENALLNCLELPSAPSDAK